MEVNRSGSNHEAESFHLEEEAMLGLKRDPVHSTGALEVVFVVLGGVEFIDFLKCDRLFTPQHSVDTSEYLTTGNRHRGNLNMESPIDLQLSRRDSAPQHCHRGP
ncbi:hypothetical protein Tco_0686356 [Tanacetum coccineum]